MENVELNRTSAQLLRLFEGGAPKSPAELINKAGLSESTLHYNLGRMIEAGLLEKERRACYKLTARGKEMLAGEEERPALGVQTIREILDPLPEAHQALVRLLLDAIIAKRHLHGRYETGWPGGMIWGSTGRLKTFVGRVIARLIGVENPVKDYRSATPKEITSRRIQLPGSEWTIQRSPYLDTPFIVLDEADKARGDLLRGFFQFMQGDAYLNIEGEKVPHRATALVTLNLTGAPGEDFAPYLRRCVAVDVDRVPLTRKEARMIAETVWNNLPERAALDLDRLKPIAEELTSEQKAHLDELLENNTIEAALWDRLPLELTALGRSALVGDLDRAILEVAWDRLVCLATLGWTTPGWRGRLAPLLKESGVGGRELFQVEEDVEKEHRQAPASSEAELAVAKTEEEMEFAERREALASGAKLLQERLKDVPRAAAKGRGYRRKARDMIRPRLKKLDRWIRSCEQIGWLDWKQLKTYEARFPELKKEVEKWRGRAFQAVRQFDEEASHYKQLASPKKRKQAGASRRKDESRDDEVRKRLRPFLSQIEAAARIARRRGPASRERILDELEQNGFISVERKEYTRPDYGFDIGLLVEQLTGSPVIENYYNWDGQKLNPDQFRTWEDAYRKIVWPWWEQLYHEARISVEREPESFSLPPPQYGPTEEPPPRRVEATLPPGEPSDDEPPDI